jgi:methionyl-tRNA formyltransferase
MKKLNIVFMGSPSFAVPSLEALAQSAHTISAVVSNPDKRRGRRGSPEPTDVKRKALELGLNTIDVEDPKSPGFAAALRELKPDLLVVVAFRILPPGVLEIPAIGSINLHASLLPRYRGAAPIHWAVINGETETGCTIFFLDERIDTGKIISRKTTPIGPDETTGDVYERLRKEGARLLAESVDAIARGETNPQPQKDELATPAPKLNRDNTRINFNRPAGEVHNFIRGLNPFPVAWCNFGGQKMNVYRSRPDVQPSKNPGRLTSEDGRLFADCSDFRLELLEVQLPGTKVMSGSDFINGYELSTGLS